MPRNAVAIVCVVFLTQAIPLRAQIATGSSIGAASGAAGGATGGVTAPAVGGTGQGTSAPSVGSIPSPSSGGTSSNAPRVPSTNGNSSGNGSGAQQSNANGSADDNSFNGNSGNVSNGNGPVTLSLQQVVNIVLGNNTAVIEARQRLQLAVEQINQLNAQGKPQLRADAADTYNSYRATTTTLGPTVQNPVLPSGDTIPTITDQAAASLSSLSSATSVSGTVAPGVSNSASFGPAGPAGAVGGSGGVGAGSSTTSGTPGIATSSGGNSAATSGAPTSSGTSSSGAAGPARTDAGSADSTGNGNGSPVSSGATSGQPVTSNGTAGEGTTGAGNAGTSGASRSPSSTPGGTDTSGSTGNTTGTDGQAVQSTSTGGASSSAAGTGSGTDATSDGAPGTSRVTSTGTGAASDGGASSASALIEPQEQIAAMPAILQTYLTAESGGSDEADELATALHQQPHSARTVARVDRSPAASGGSTQSSQQVSTNATGTGTAADATTVSDAQRNTYAARATGSQYIDLFGYFPAARDVQNSIRDFYLLDLERVENETALAAKNTFFNVLYAQAEFAVEQEQVNYAAENVRIVTDRRQQGVAADYDVLTAETALANARQLLITAQNQLQLANSQLSYLVGIDPDRRVTLLAPATPPVKQAFDILQSERIATQRRPEVRQAQKNVAIANRLIKLAGATLAPTLGIVGVAQYNSTDTTFTPHSLATISAQLGIPIDDGGATRSRVRSAKIDLQTQQINFGSLQLSVGLEVRQAILNIDNAQARVSTAQVGVTQAEEARRLAVVRYENGLGTLLDVTNAVAQLATAQSNLADANFSYETALATLVRNEGGR